MIVTKFIEKEGGIKFVREQAPNIKNDLYSMFNTGGVECEIGEFLYGLVKMVKPKIILETGTHYGISSTYFGIGLKENGEGKLITLDTSYYENQAINLWKQLGIDQHIDFVQCHSLKYTPKNKIDILFLDSEPKWRYDEFIKYFDDVNDGGIIIIHDLHHHFYKDTINTNQPDFAWWPYGDFRPKIGKYILEKQVEVFSFFTPRGFTMFQKRHKEFTFINFQENL
jgi:hypothetical protein